VNFTLGAIIAPMLHAVNRESLEGLEFKSGASDTEAQKIFLSAYLPV